MASLMTLAIVGRSEAIFMPHRRRATGAATAAIAAHVSIARYWSDRYSWLAMSAFSAISMPGDTAVIFAARSARPPDWRAADQHGLRRHARRATGVVWPGGADRQQPITVEDATHLQWPRADICWHVLPEDAVHYESAMAMCQRRRDARLWFSAAERLPMPADISAIRRPSLLTRATTAKQPTSCIKLRCVGDA